MKSPRAALYEHQYLTNHGKSATIWVTTSSIDYQISPYDVVHRSNYQIQFTDPAGAANAKSAGSGGST
jgi:hypothetical protein